MVTWLQNDGFYSRAIDLTAQYGQSHLENFQPTRTIQIVGIQMLEKFHVNLINALRLLPEVHNEHLNFLSLALILRALITDVIIYNYLKRMESIGGNDSVDIESNALDAFFVKAYLEIARAESVLADNQKSDAEIVTMFTTQFPNFMSANEARSRDSFRSQAHKDILSTYRQTNQIANLVKIDTEMGKIDFTKGDNHKQIAIAYKYLNQFHHYSTLSRSLFTVAEFEERNRYFTALTLGMTVNVTVQIVADLMPNTETTNSLLVLGQDIQNGVTA